jgi:large subunit ribosomal protein L18
MIRKPAVRRERSRMRRKKHIHKIIKGTALCPRLVVFRSNHHMYAQLVDDDAGKTISGVSSRMPGLFEELKGKKPAEKARRVGEAVAAKAKEKEIERVVFDRNGFLYHGRMKALAEGARAAGLKF